ncbi:metallophosphoesterase [Flindersiella endophytica]
MSETPAPEPARPRPTSLQPDQIKFHPARPVRWLSPPLLTSTAVRVLGAEFFGAYLDKRELQGVLPSRVHDHSGTQNGDGDFWFDYIGDLGDGFDATYSMAWLLAQPSLDVAESRDSEEVRTLPRGQVLVMGGDQVYPTPSWQAYENRFRGPYRSALPTPPAQPPSLYALPGNHDWYDGLTAFLRVFAKDGWIGGWRTQQARSYFALQLPHRWWLFAVDTQISAYIDHPQMEYFADVARRLGPGDRVLVCLPQPGWVKQKDSPGSYDPIDFFLRRVIQPTGATCSVLLTGDLHHYARYKRVPLDSGAPDPGNTDTGAGTAPTHLVTCGGGGAFLYGTDQLPEEISTPASDATARSASRPKKYHLQETYPSKSESNRFSLGVFWRLVARNPGFDAAIGVIHTLLMLAFVSSQEHLLTAASVGMSAFVLVSTIALAGRGRRVWLNRALGTAHGLAHIGLGLLGSLLWNALPSADLDWVWRVLLAAGIYGPISAVVGTELVALYFLVAGRFSININELFAGQNIEDSKSFLRMRISGDGSLTIYPVAVDKVSKHWRAAPDDPVDAPWIAPVQEPRTHLVEPPIVVEKPS